MKKILSCTLFFLSALLSSSIFADNSSDELAIKQIQLFSEAFHQVKRHYVEPISDEQLMQHAISGMLNQLDPHSSWLDQSAYDNLVESAEGEYAGIGVEVVQDGDYLLIVTPLDDSPAQKAGLQTGDKIIQVDNTSLKNMPYSESIELMRGKKGSLLQLKIVREGEKEPLNFEIRRSTIKITSVKGKLYEQKYAYLRIAQFQKKTAKDITKQLDKLAKKTDTKQLAGIILDLRNNPGGMLSSAVQVSDLFLSNGLIVYTEGQTEQSRESFYTSESGAYTNIPLVVLINQGSASASEIVAGALQDHQRALIIGQRSFGKGSVQTILPLAEGQAIKMTTAFYYTPLGHSIQASGINPDIEIKPSKLIESATNAITEKQLAHHLSNQNTAQEKANPQPKNTSNDYFILEAIKLLKAIQFSQAGNI